MSGAQDERSVFARLLADAGSKGAMIVTSDDYFLTDLLLDLREAPVTSNELADLFNKSTGKQVKPVSIRMRLRRLRAMKIIDSVKVGRQVVHSVVWWVTYIGDSTPRPPAIGTVIRTR